MCFEIIKNVKWSRVFLAAVVYVIISQVVRLAEASLTMGYYLDPAYFGVWSQLMMPNEGPPPMAFFFWSLIFAFIIGLVLACFYVWVKKLIPQKSIWEKACYFTTIVSVLTLVLAYFPMYLLINLPLTLFIIWFVSTVIILYLSALVFVKTLE